MTNTTPLIDVVQTPQQARDLPEPPLLIRSTVEGFLDQHDIGQGSLQITRIGEGQSNATFRIQREGADVILRRGPRPPIPRSTHDMIREARVQSALATRGFAVPTIRAVEETGELLGVPFYIMDTLDGDVITSELPERFESDEARRQIGFAAVDALHQLHSLDVSTEPLASLGRPEGYLQRQIERFTHLWPQQTQRDIPLVDELSQWLGRHVPTTQRHSVIHGDYRIGNLMYSPSTTPEIQAVLDWEMATLGDPLADLGYFAATYASGSDTPTVMELTPVTRQPGFPSRDELVARYNRESSLDLSQLNWYQVLALWKSAIFCEAIYTRFLNGEAPDDPSFAAGLKHGVPALLESAHQFTTA
ncbi:phosphotransferase family protein [Auritidibacter ignavus]|uniref:Phosphotransferase family protein n=1 Tax=Auritidibacter ignavus TaxID=678932 RepID=A0AAJ6AFB3_9MICC|nr:phosphotransferase family protein [Auritidibacter ignavus]WGH92223.1 phosphotransferase family protein [Auritidibacter ignavus]